VVSARFDSGTNEAPRAKLPQVFDVIVVAVRSDGSREIVDPRGGGEHLRGSRSLVGVVIDPGLNATTSLARIPKETLEREPPIVRIEARLLHHRMSPRAPRADAAEPLVRSLR
jgi:hypothetical protein